MVRSDFVSSRSRSALLLLAFPLFPVMLVMLLFVIHTISQS